MHIDAYGKRFAINEYPDNCPRCHHGIESIPIEPHLVEFDNLRGPWVQAIFRCPRKDCYELFIANYRAAVGFRGGYENNLTLINLEPVSPVVPTFHEAIEELSPSYIEIYVQSFLAEEHGLDQLAGMGYRKALEFLIKDYLISILPEDEEEIRSSMLSRVITKLVENKNIKACAERAAWLGNDEAHYERKWENHDIQDLKKLLELTASWILSELQTQQYMQAMER